MFYPILFTVIKLVTSMIAILVRLRSILDIMDFTEKDNIPGLMIFIDFRKAFDTLEWNFSLTV